MTASALPAPHRVLECAGRLHAALDGVAGSSVVFLAASEKRAALLELTRAVARVEELRLRVLAAGRRWATWPRPTAPATPPRGWPAAAGSTRGGRGGSLGSPRPWTSGTPRCVPHWPPGRWTWPRPT